MQDVRCQGTYKAIEFKNRDVLRRRLYQVKRRARAKAVKAQTVPLAAEERLRRNATNLKSKKKQKTAVSLALLGKSSLHPASTSRVTGSRAT